MIFCTFSTSNRHSSINACDHLHKDLNFIALAIYNIWYGLHDHNLLLMLSEFEPYSLSFDSSFVSLCHALCRILIFNYDDL